MTEHRLIPPLATPEVVALRRSRPPVNANDAPRDQVLVAAAPPTPFIIVNSAGKRADSFLSAANAKRALKALNGA